ncbi:ribosome biogenesis GTP-binding protein YihA/YsxC [Thermincola potens]|uniref:Probable GTP-binding protein EngB n=1 Tax=Thermincola potens (strain JR) TaxID=635013 RepID=D5XBG7_THEPJ|nr:ribosome biogenesis GTP-binding protein YihA/YsxC [Thermincola potens]ADG83396.1 ribosome biogenesis GTP-binding protein YsxC [Thermincola potens JR]
MNITAAEFIISAPGPKQYPVEGYPEIAFAGRSNVGKSSLINTLTNRKGLAKTSSRPGKTQLLNFYLINKSLYFVDLPGYGFARVSKETKSYWGKMIENYLKNREELVAVVQLIDIRHAPSRDDITMHQWLKHYRIPTVLVLNKADKITRGKWAQHAKIIRQSLMPAPETPVVVFSAETRQGREELLGILDKMVKSKEEGRAVPEG